MGLLGKPTILGNPHMFWGKFNFWFKYGNGNLKIAHLRCAHLWEVMRWLNQANSTHLTSQDFVSMVFFFQLTITQTNRWHIPWKKKRTKGQTLSDGVQPLSFPKSSVWFLFHDWSTTPTPLNVPLPPRNSRPNYQGPVSYWFRGRGVGWLAFDFCCRKDFKQNKHPSILKKARPPCITTRQDSAKLPESWAISLFFAGWEGGDWKIDKGTSWKPQKK